MDDIGATGRDRGRADGRGDDDIETLLGLKDRPLASRLGGRHALAIAAVVALAVLAALLFRPGDRDEATRWVTEPAVRGAVTQVVTATGSVQPTNKVDVSSELSGTVRTVRVDYNSVVKVGQVLAELDTDKLAATAESSRARLVAARANVAVAQATADETERQYQRKKALADRQVSSVYDLDTAHAARDRAAAQLASARAEVGVAEADLRLNETNLAKAAIRSPIDGVVLVRNVDPGQTVASSLQAPVLFSIAEDLTAMEIQVDVDEADVGRVAEGQTATFSVDAYPDRRFPARISVLRFASETVQGVVTYKAVLSVDNSHLLLRPGMTATAEIVVQHLDDALLVPNAALRFAPPATEASGGNGGFLRRLMPGIPQFRAASPHVAASAQHVVWILREGRATAVPVTTGATDGQRTAVTAGGLRAGEAVIVDAAAPRK